MTVVADQQISLIIPAAGSGERMGKTVPKPYLKLDGKSVLEHTLSAFTGLKRLGEVIISTSPEFHDETEELLSRLFGHLRHSVVRGGTERQDSIRNALKNVSEKSGLIAVHDAVRPFVSFQDIEKCVSEATKWGGAVLAVPVRDTIKVAGSEQEIVSTPKRDSLWHAQTPQVFWAALLREAYANAAEYNISGSDDSSLVEAIGGKVVLVEGSASNFKLTYPMDLQIAEFLIQKEDSQE